MSDAITEMQLPDIDQLIKMVSDDPRGLGKIREQLCSQLIANAPQQYQKRLHGLQFQIDMERRRSKNPMHSCIKLSQMMLDSYQTMQDAITNLDDTEYNINQAAFKAESDSAEIIDFKLSQEN